MICYTQENGNVATVSFGAEFLEKYGLEVAAKKTVPEGISFYYVEDKDIEAMTAPIETWELSGTPDGVGGWTEEEEQAWQEEHKTPEEPKIPENPVFSPPIMLLREEISNGITGKQGETTETAGQPTASSDPGTSGSD